MKQMPCMTGKSGGKMDSAVNKEGELKGMNLGKAVETRMNRINTDKSKYYRQSLSPKGENCFSIFRYYPRSY